MLRLAQVVATGVQPGSCYLATHWYTSRRLLAKNVILSDRDRLLVTRAVTNRGLLAFKMAFPRDFSHFYPIGIETMNLYRIYKSILISNGSLVKCYIQTYFLSYSTAEHMPVVLIIIS